MFCFLGFVSYQTKGKKSTGKFAKLIFLALSGTIIRHF